MRADGRVGDRGLHGERRLDGAEPGTDQRVGSREGEATRIPPDEVDRDRRPDGEHRAAEVEAPRIDALANVAGHAELLSIEQTTPDVVAPNRFWIDYATATPDQPFVSSAIVEAGGSFLEAMMALSVLDLPFEAGAHEIAANGDQRTLRAATPLLLVRKEVTRTEKAPDQAPLLLGENFFRLDDRYRFENGERRDAFVTDEFLANIAQKTQGLEVDQWNEARDSDAVQSELDSAQTSALEESIEGTPTLVVSGPGGTSKLVGAVPIDRLAAEIEEVRSS